MLTHEEQLAQEDKRIHAIYPVGSGLGMLISKIHSSGHDYFCPTPSPPALYLNIAKKNLCDLRQILDQEYGGAKLNKIFITRPEEYPSCPELRLPENNTTFYNCVELYFAHVIFSYTALESFANEVIANEYHKKINQTPENKEQLETESFGHQRNALKNKIKTELPTMLGIDSIVSKNPSLWDRFIAFEDLRDNLIHFKSAFFLAEADSQFLNNFIKFITNKQTDYTSEVVQIMRYFVPDSRRWLKEFPYG